MKEDAHGHTALTYLAHIFTCLTQGPSLARIIVERLRRLLLGQARRQGVDDAKLQVVLGIYL